MSTQVINSLPRLYKIIKVYLILALLGALLGAGYVVATESFVILLSTASVIFIAFLTISRIDELVIEFRELRIHLGSNLGIHLGRLNTPADKPKASAQEVERQAVSPDISRR